MDVGPNFRNGGQARSLKAGVICLTLCAALVATTLVAGCRPRPTATSPTATSSSATSLSADEPSSSPVSHSQSPADGPQPAAESAALAPIAWAAARIEPEPLRDSIRRAARYLARITDENGKFAYIVNTNPEVPPTDEYNVVRHAGTMYGMGMYLERYPDPPVKAALLRAGHFLHKQMLAVPGKEERLAIWSDPKVTQRDEAKHAKLGSSGLGLIALVYLEHVQPGFTPREDLRRLAGFLVSMQLEDGNFHRSLLYEKDARPQGRSTLYYPGETALGLAMLYEIDPQPQWLNSAARAISAMARLHSTANASPDHWTLLSTARFWPHFDQSTQPVDRATVLRSCVRLSGRLMEPHGQLDEPLFHGCITGDGRTTPTATRVEGLMAGMTYLPDDEVELRATIRRAVEDSLLFLMRSQVSAGPYRGGIPYAVSTLPDDHPQNIRNYNLRATEIRIDYVHHAMSAMIQYDEMFLRQDK